MANEITMSFQTLLNNGGLSDSYSSGSIAIDQTTAKMVRNVQTIPTANTALSLGSVSTPGVAIFVNLDDTNFVDIGLTGSYFVRLKPGEAFVMRLAGAPFALADTASVELFYIIYDD